MIEHKQRRTSAMDAVEQRLAGLRHQDDAIVGDAPDWTALEAAVLLGLDRRQKQAQMRRQLGWTGALALVTGLAGGMAQQPWPAAMAARERRATGLARAGAVGGADGGRAMVSRQSLLAVLLAFMAALAGVGVGACCFARHSPWKVPFTR
jgi:hypothetical protein